MLVLGIDPGSQITGYGLVTATIGSAPRLVACGVIRAAGRGSFNERLKFIYDEVAHLIDKYRPDQVVIEDIFYARNAKSSLQLGQARAAAILAALNAGLPVTAYAPAEVKLAVTGRGSAAKEQVRYMVIQLLAEEIEEKAMDASDALAIALCHALRWRA